MSAPVSALSVAFISALLCDEQVYRDVIAALGLSSTRRCLYWSAKRWRRLPDARFAVPPE